MLTILPYIVLGLLIVTPLMLFVRNPDQRKFIIFLAYVSVSINVSQVYITVNPTYITETGFYSRQNNSFIAFYILNAMMFLGISIGGGLLSAIDRRVLQPWSPAPINAQRIAAILLLAIMAIELLNVFTSYPNGFSGVEFKRVDFYEDYARLKFLPTLFGVLAFFTPLVAPYILLTTEDRLSRTLSGISLIMYYVYLKGIGQVFSGFMFTTSMVVAVYLIIKSRGLMRIRIPVKRIAILGACVVLLGIVTSFKGRGISSYQGGVFDGIIYRILVLQGSASAEIYYLWENGAVMSAHDLMQGRDWWIIHTMPSRAGAAFLESGVNLQGAIPGTFLLFGGAAGGGLLCFLYGLTIAAINHAIVTALSRGSVLALFPASYLWVWVIGMYSRASLEEIVKPKFIITIFLYVAVMILAEWRSSKRMIVNGFAQDRGNVAT